MNNSAKTLHTYDDEKADKLTQQGWVCEKTARIFNSNWSRPEDPPQMTRLDMWICTRPDEKINH
jgi:hypothetical protein